jgi:phosphatidylglycerol:prolipoprotein diacylglycerol transferase
MNMGILLWLGSKYKDRLKTGDLLLVYMIIYPVGRFTLEFVRLNSAEIAGINANQTMMLLVAIAAIIGLYFRHRTRDVPVAQGKSEGK